MAVRKWRVIAEHVRRRVLEWKCETRRVGDFEVVQTLSELNLTAAACLSAFSPTARSGGNLASLGMRGNIIHGPWHSCHAHLYTRFTRSSSFIPSIFNANAQDHKVQIFLMLY